MEKYKRLKYRGIKINPKIHIVILFLFIIIGYALIRTSINIEGTLGFKQSWNVYFDNISQASSSDTLVEPVINSSSDKIGINFKIDLKKLDSFYEFEVDIVNDGDIDSVIYSLNLNITPDKFAKYYNYTFTDLLGSNISAGDIIPANSSKRVKMRVSFVDSPDVNLADVIGKNYANENREVNFNCDLSIRQAN